MLKSYKPKQSMPRNTILWGLVGLLVVSGIIALIFSFNSPSDGADEVNAVYTNAAATLAAQQLTLQASDPTVTPTLFTATPTITLTLAATPTLLVQPPLATNTQGGGGSGAVGCNNSVFVTDVTIPDDTAVTPGQSFTKTWKLQNNGTCPWTPTYKVSFVSGNAMNGAATPIGITVAPGASGDVSVAMVAPATNGDVIGYWILTNDDGQNFGTSFYVKVKVGGASTTGTVTVVATGTGGTATPSIPTPVNNPDITLSCTPDGGGTNYEHAGTLTWEDLSNNETGFYIYVNGSVIGQAPVNATSYVIPGGNFYGAGVTSTFGIAAFNGTGSADTKTVTKSCP